MPFKNGQWEPEDDSVSTQINKLTASDSPYIKQAEYAGKAYAGRRGLINSSIAGGAARRAAIESALPIASQDAGQLNSKNLAYQGDQYQRGQIQMQTDATAALQRAQADAAERLSKINNDATMTLAEKQAAWDKEKLSLAGDLDLGKIKTQGDIDMGKIAAQGTIDSDRQAQVIASQERTAALDAAVKSNQSYLDAFTNLANNKDIPAVTRDAYISDIKNTRSSGLDMIQQVYGVELNWSGKPKAPGTEPAKQPVPQSYSVPNADALNAFGLLNGGYGAF